MLNRFPQTPARHRGTGRVLRVKEGYNPNSSSLGSIVFSIHTALLASPVLLAGAAAWIAARASRAALKPAGSDAPPAKEQP